MRRRAFLGWVTAGAMAIIGTTPHGQGIYIADVKVNLYTRLYDWLFYRPWTPEEIKERVAWSVAHTNYQSWHKPEEHAGPRPVALSGHSFTQLTDEEIAAAKKDGSWDAGFEHEFHSSRQRVTTNWQWYTKERE